MNYHPHKFLSDGSVNPDWKPRMSGKRQSRPWPKKCKKQVSSFHHAKFVAWDGEGLNHGPRIDGCQAQDYVLLANSDGEEFYNAQGLTTLECLKAITDNAVKNQRSKWHSIHVVFGGTYDFNMILRDLPKDDLERLEAYESDRSRGVWYQGYIVNVILRKYLIIRKLRDINHPYKIDSKTHKPTLDIEISVTLWDVIGFFQSSFLQAIKKWLPKDDAVTALIEKGKAARQSFDVMDMDFIREYNRMELILLVKLMQALQAQLKHPDIGLVLQRWDGAGAIATALFRKHSAKEHIKPLPASIEQAARHAFFGGRFESIQFGRNGKFYDYDLCSAYPSATLNLPSLSDPIGAWKHTINCHIDLIDLNCLPLFSLCRITWDYSRGVNKQAPFYPFPYRSQSEQRILFPSRGHSWAWLPEVLAAIVNGFPVKVHEIYSYHSDTRPFDWVRNYYELRRAWINQAANGSTEPNGEKVIKLGLNSLYGKMAQHVGYDEETGKIPPFHSIAYAGFITSLTRARLFDAAMRAPESVIFFATDGIFTTKQLSPLSVTTSKELGVWELTTGDEIINVQSGVYFTRNGETWACRMRGFDKPKTSAQAKEWAGRVLSAWTNKKQSVSFPCTRFVGYKSALISDEWFRRFCGWYTISHEGIEGRELALLPNHGKRIPAWGNGYPSQAARHLVKTAPEFSIVCSYAKDWKEFPLSEPYEVGWGCEVECDGIPAQVLETEFSLDDESEED